MLTIDLHWQGYTYSGARRVGKAGPFALYAGDDYWSWSFVFGESRTSGSGEARDIHEARAAVVQRITEIVHAIDPTAVIRDHGTREAFECRLGADHDPADTAAQLFDAALKRRPEYQPPKSMLDAAWVIVGQESWRAANSGVVRSVLDRYEPELTGQTADRYTVALRALRAFCDGGPVPETWVSEATAPASELIDEAYRSLRVRAIYYLLIATHPDRAVAMVASAIEILERLREEPTRRA